MFCHSPPWATSQVQRLGSSLPRQQRKDKVMWRPGEPTPGCQCNRQGYKLVEKHRLGVFFSPGYWDENIKALQRVSHESLSSTGAERSAVEAQKYVCGFKEHWVYQSTQDCTTQPHFSSVFWQKALLTPQSPISKEGITHLSLSLLGAVKGPRHQTAAGTWGGKSEGGTHGPQREGEWGLPGSSELACLNWNLVFAHTEMHSYGLRAESPECTARKANHNVKLYKYLDRVV